MRGSGCARVLGVCEASAKVARASGSRIPELERVTELAGEACGSYGRGKGY